MAVVQSLVAVLIASNFGITAMQVMCASTIVTLLLSLLLQVICDIPLSLPLSLSISLPLSHCPTAFAPPGR
jgi:hypothetical protein